MGCLSHEPQPATEACAPNENPTSDLSVVAQPTETHPPGLTPPPFPPSLLLSVCLELAYLNSKCKRRTISSKGRVCRSGIILHNIQ